MQTASPFQLQGFGGFGRGGPPPRDVLAIVALIFITFSLQSFGATRGFVDLLRLSPGVFAGRLWQIGTFPFVGFGSASLWILLELLILYWFGKDVFWQLGRRRFWTMLAWSTISAAIVAALVELALMLTVGLSPFAFVLMQGQRMLITILIAAFATLFGNATILLFFVLPIRARWFLWLEVLFAFIAFLNTKDLAGFCGVCTAVFVTYAGLVPGGPRRVLRDSKRELERRVLQWRLARMRRSRSFDVIDGDGDGDRWVH